MIHAPSPKVKTPETVAPVPRGVDSTTHLKAGRTMTNTTATHPFDASVIGWALDQTFPLPDWVEEVGPWEFEQDQIHRQCEKVLVRWERRNSDGKIEVSRPAVSILVDDFYDNPNSNTAPTTTRVEAIYVQMPPGEDSFTPGEARLVANALNRAADTLDGVEEPETIECDNVLQFINGALQKRDLEEVDVAQRLDLTTTDVLNFLSGREDLTFEFLIGIAALVDAPAGDLAQAYISDREEGRL